MTKERGKPKKAKRRTAQKGPKQGKELISLKEAISPMPTLTSPACKSSDLIVVGGLEQVSP
jgi:hypothetical protein